ncbi:Arm DNA-binding domain-containing protein, partial [Aeromonas hydrophila]|uniref:Arm DNA-binding domain-containing protein n=2 Tax=Aeromonas hydrophila TaxID=644 RepID=UPI001112F996
MAITDTWLRGINGKPYAGQSEVTDGDGLGVRISPKGLITFQVRYRKNGKQVRKTIGRYPLVSLREARIKADLNRPHFPRHLKSLKLRSFRRCYEPVSYTHL